MSAFERGLKPSDESLAASPAVLQIDLKADVNTAVVSELSPATDYSLTVHAVYPSRVGDSATVTVQTSERTLSPKADLFNGKPPVYISPALLSCPFSPIASGDKLPCPRGGSVLAASGLDSPSREAQRIQDLHPKMCVH